MRHLKSGRKLGRNPSHRKAMYRNMVTSLMEHGRIQTTEAKAKELRRIADRVINLGRKLPLSALEGLEGEALAKARAARVHHIRQARRWITDRAVLEKVFGEYAERYKDRPGGFTRVLKTGFRAGDKAPMAVVELVDELEVATETGPNADEVEPAAEAETAETEEREESAEDGASDAEEPVEDAPAETSSEETGA